MENLILRKYGIQFKYYKNETDFTQIHFEVDVIYQGKSQFGNYHFMINRKKVYINELASDLIIEQLAEKAGACLYPMEIITSAEGPFQEITNYEEIKKRWDIKKIELQNYYEGEIAESIISNLDVVYSNKSKIETAMNDDLFLTFYFMPIYRKHEKRIAKYKKEIAFMTFKQPFYYDIIQEVEEFLSESKKQVIRISGFSEQSNGSEPDLEFEYKINNETKSIFSIVGSVNLPKEKSKTQKIEIEMYQLN